jgi:hypothetical protein
VEAAGIEPAQELSRNSHLLGGSGAESGALPATSPDPKSDLAEMVASMMDLPLEKRQEMLELLVGMLRVSIKGSHEQSGKKPAEGGLE